VSTIAYLPSSMKFSCSNCKTIVRMDEYHASMMSKLHEARQCLACNTWLEKANDREHFFIGGKSYAMHNCRVILSRSELQEYSPLSTDFIVRRGDQYFAMSWVWDEGVIPEAFRSRLADNAEWICPLCLDPFHAPAGKRYSGSACDRCKDAQRGALYAVCKPAVTAA